MSQALQQFMAYGTIKDGDAYSIENIWTPRVCSDDRPFKYVLFLKILESTNNITNYQSQVASYVAHA